jgi:hypothetical protein
VKDSSSLHDIGEENTQFQMDTTPLQVKATPDQFFPQPIQNFKYPCIERLPMPTSLSRKKSQHIGNKRHLINHPTNKDAPGPNVSIGQPLGVTRVRGSELFHNRHDAA